jgi:hypothetical protein
MILKLTIDPLMVILDLARDVLDVIRSRTVPKVQINDGNYVPKNRISEIGLGFPLSCDDVGVPLSLEAKRTLSATLTSLQRTRTKLLTDHPNDRPTDSGEWLRTCTIITGEPNELVAQIHPRTPVILPPATSRDLVR